LAAFADALIACWGAKCADGNDPRLTSMATNLPLGDLMLLIGALENAKGWA
jgi:hypothetical protein